MSEQPLERVDSFGHAFAFNGFELLLIVLPEVWRIDAPRPRRTWVWGSVSGSWAWRRMNVGDA